MERTQNTHRQRQPVARGHDQEHLHRATYRRIRGVPGRDPLRPGREQGPGAVGINPDRGGIRDGYGEMEAGFADSVAARGYRPRDGNVLPAVPVLAVREMQLADAGRAQEYEERASGVLSVP